MGTIPATLITFPFSAGGGGSGLAFSILVSPIAGFLTTGDRFKLEGGLAFSIFFLSIGGCRTRVQKLLVAEHI